MKRLILALLIIATAAAGYADDRDDAEKLKAFRDLNPGPSHATERRVEFHAGYIELHAMGMDWRIFYLPFLAPLPGARLEDGSNIPDPFAMSGGMPYTTSMPPMFDHDRSRDVEREYKRIEKLTKEQKVVVKPDQGSSQQ